MIKTDKRKNKAGETRTQIRVVESYRPGRGLPPKQRTIRDFGCIEDQADPVVFMDAVVKFNDTYKEENYPLKIECIGTAKMYDGNNLKQNYGYKFLEGIYDMLGIDRFIKDHVRKDGFRGEYSPDEIFKFLVLSRMLNPDSKRASCQAKNIFYGMDYDFTLQDVYRSLDVFSGLETELQRHLNDVIKEKIGRDLSHAFYDVTNYFFEIDFPDGDDDLRKRGVSKEHRVDPIAAMGLFIDGNGLPVSMSIFPGNTSESVTLQPTMKDVKESYGLGRIVVVADKGLNSSKNINPIINNGDGFVFSQILRGKKGQRYHGELFDPFGWTENKDGTYKYKLFEEEYVGVDSENRKVTRKRNVLIYWDKADADMAKRKRDEKLEKAERNVKNNAYSIKKGVDEYTKENIVHKETGEVLEDVVKKRSVDLEKAEKDALFDGYFCIITSELDYDERKIRQSYGGLWRIEQSFRILKSDLYARPVFVSKNEHIRAHFLICFVALLVIRLIQLKMGKKALSAERIARALNAATLTLFKNGVILLDDVGGALAFQKRTDKNGKLVDTLIYSDEDEIAMDYKLIQELFATDCYDTFIRQEKFNEFLKNINLALQWL